MSHEEIEVRQPADGDGEVIAEEIADGSESPESGRIGELQPSHEELVQAYRVAARSRVTEANMVRAASRGEVSFSIWGPGEEVHGVATSLAFSKVVNREHFGIVFHYRSGAMFAMWCCLNGRKDYTETVLRQQFSKVSDTMGGGRQMVNHFSIPQLGVLPVQSPVGMQLGKAAGYARGFQAKGIRDGVAVAIIGDGTTAEGDLHEAMTAASVWDLPLLVMITDNKVAISTLPEEGRGIKDFHAYATAFGIEYFECDGREFQDVYDTTLSAALHIRDQQKPALLYVRDLPRFNGHSSAADVTFDLNQDDPLIRLGEQLVEWGLATEGDVLRRTEGTGRDFFHHHELGRIMEELDVEIHRIIHEIREEPEADPSTLTEFIYAPFPSVTEVHHTGQTVISYSGAIRAAIDQIFSEHDGALLGQDVGRLGGVMQATAGLKARHPGRIIDAPLNEPLIMGTACGMGLHDDLVSIAEIQFGDYSLNAFHWFVHMGNLYWSTRGDWNPSVITRMPVDPFGGGAVYHSMSLDGYFSPIPGLVILMPSTSYDVYGLLMTAAEYGGPVVVLEPKWMYRQALGPPFPEEPTEPDAVLALRKSIMHGEIPRIDPTVRVPFSKAATRRQGDDLTIVAWGRAVWTSLAAAEELAKEGIEAEVIDLRTLVPPDLDTVFESVDRTRRLVVAAEDRPFAGFVRSIQGAVVERFPGTITRAVGQMNVPGIAQAHTLEEATILTAETVQDAARAVLEAEITTASRAAEVAAGTQEPAPSPQEPGIAWASQQPQVDVATASDWLWIPRRYDNG